MIRSYPFLLSFVLSACGHPSEKKPSNSPDSGSKPGGVEFRLPERPTGWVSDFENILQETERKTLDSLIEKHEAETGIEIAVVTLAPDSSLINSDRSFDSLSLALFNQWGVGKKGKDNGIGLLISSRLRRVRIETGKGMTELLTDAEATSILNERTLPAFRKGRYYEGITACLEAIIRETK